MASVRPDELSGVSSLAVTDIIIAETNPSLDTRKVVKITQGDFIGSISGFTTSATNIGTGSGIISGVKNMDIKVKSLIPGANIQLSGDSNSLTIHSSITGEATTATNIGTGSGIISGLDGYATSR